MTPAERLENLAVEWSKLADDCGTKGGASREALDLIAVTFDRCTAELCALAAELRMEGGATMDTKLYAKPALSLKQDAGEHRAASDSTSAELRQPTADLMPMIEEAIERAYGNCDGWARSSDVKTEIRQLFNTPELRQPDAPPLARAYMESVSDYVMHKEDCAKIGSDLGTCTCGLDKIIGAALAGYSDTTGQAREQRLAEALTNLLAKLDQVAKDTAGIFAMAHIHGSDYTGANWSKEYAEARAALAASPAPTKESKQ